MQAKQKKSYDTMLSITFECLMNEVWMYVPPSLAAYDLGAGSSIETVMESLRKGECLKGASGTVYRLSNIPSEDSLA